MNYYTEEQKILNKVGTKYIKNEASSRASYENLMTAFTIPQGKSRSLTTPNNMTYPEYYGGTYINEEGKLVIYIIEDKENYKKELTKIMGTEDIIFSLGPNSYNSMITTMDILDKFKTQNPNDNISNNFNYWAIHDAQNSIVVKLNEFNQDKINEFKKYVSDSSTIKFEQCVEEFKINAIMDLSAGGPTSNASIAYRAKRNGKSGIVCSGHATNLNSLLKVPSSSSFIGICTARQFSGSVDAAFVEITDSSFIPSNVIAGVGSPNNAPPSLSTKMVNPAVGSIVYKSGRNGVSGGTVVSTSVSGTVEGIKFSNLTSASYTSTPGDSGGVIFQQSGSEKVTCGVNFGNDGNNGLFSKATNVASALGITRY